MSAHNPSRGHDWRMLISCAVAAGALVQLVQSSVAFRDASLPVEVFISHTLVVVGFHLAIAFALGWLGGGWLWSAAAFLFPISTVLDFQAAPLLWFPLFTFLVGAWFWFPRGPGAPLVAAAFGAGTGVEILVLKSTLGSDVGFVLYQAALIAIATTMTWATTRWICARWAPRPAAILVIALAAWLVAASISLFGGPGRPNPPPGAKAGVGSPPPVVLVVLDTLRLDHLGVFGYTRKTAPNLARFASEPGVLSVPSVANAPSSLPSHASMFTGLYPVHHGAHKPTLADESPPIYAYPLRDDVPTLATLLAGAGYWTVGVSANFGPLAPAFGLERGFQAYDAQRAPTSQLMLKSPWVPRGWARDWLRIPWRGLHDSPIFASSELLIGVTYRRAETITDLAIDVIEAAGDHTFFLFLNYFDPHSPYMPKRGFTKRFPGVDPSSRTPGLPRKTARAILRSERDLTKRERDHIVSLYDSEIAYLDEELGRLLDSLRAHPRYRDMLIIVTSDHGEAFGEHRHLRHSASLYTEILDVPLLVKPPTKFDRAAEALRSGVAQSVDLFPTILEHASVPVPSEIDGVAWGRGRKYALAWLFPDPKLAEINPGRFKRELQSVQSVDWKLVRSSTGEVELYDLRVSPQEHTSVATQHSDKVRELSSILAPYSAYRADHRPADEGAVSEEVLERLRSLGYVP